MVNNVSSFLEIQVNVMDLEFVPLKPVMNLYNNKQKNTKHNLRKGNIRENEFIALN